MKKRLICLLLAVCMVFTLIPATVFAVDTDTAPDLANPYKDVKETDWFYDSVQYARINGIFNGTSPVTFDPNGTMTRAMFVTVLGRMAGVDAAAYADQAPFDDVPASAYYAPYVAWAAKHGITSGTGEGTFSPDALINREQMALFFVRYFDAFQVNYHTDVNITTMPVDMESVSSYAWYAVLKLWKHGLLNGDGTNFMPDGSATRAQAATLAMRTDEAVETWYMEPGVPSARVRLDPNTGLPCNTAVYTVVYTDGVASEDIFAYQTYKAVKGAVTPAFIGTPTRDGYVFKGWSPSIAETVVGNVTYTALWTPVLPEPVMYTVTYTDGVPSTEIFADQSIEVEEGSATPAFDGNPVRSGYVFKGWSPKVADTVTGNVTYTAQWESNVVTPAPVICTVTYTDGVAGTEVFTDRVSNIEAGSITPEFIGTPTREGYIFRGWSPEVETFVTGSITYTAQWEAVVAVPTICSVQFYDGTRLIDTLYAEPNQPLGAVPSIEKSSKANAILMGYYTDSACTQPFYAENPVTGSMTVYAKYQEMGPQETLNFTSFAQMDQSPDLRFDVSGFGDPAQAVTLEVMDGSDPVELAFTPTSGGYTVYAPAGYNEGCSYQLHLADGWTFTGKPETIRSASFSIEMAEVENLQMNDDIIYIQDTGDISYSVGGQTYEVMTSDLLTEAGGSFPYDSSGLAVGDTICIYVDKHPNDRNNGSDTLLPVVYAKVTAVNGTSVSFAKMTAEEQLALYEIPDNFPIIVSALPTESTGTVNIRALDTAMYATMMGDGYDLARAMEAVSVGDFVTLYVSEDSIASESDLYYGQITAYADGEITFVQVDRQIILDSMDLYTNVDLESADYISDAEKAAIEAAVLEDVSESGFAEDAAFLLADMITKTDAFRSTRGIQDLIITDSQGNELTSDQIEMLNLGGSFELTDDVELTVELITNKAQLRYGSGVRIAVGVDAEFEVELESEDKININLSATFVEEVALDPRVKGSLVYKEILWIPVPIGVSVGATVDIRNFTAFSFEAEILTVPADDPGLLDQFKDVIQNPEKLADIPGLPDDLSEGLQTVGDVFDKIEELQDEISKAVDTAEETSDQILGYAEDIRDLWAFLETNDLGDKATYEELCKKLGKTNITSDLLGMLDLEPIEEGELNTEYYESLEALLERYCEMLEQETDWVTLVEEEMGKVEACINGIAIGVEFTFMVRADMSLAIGSNLEYEVGKRYEFWFKIGLFKPSAGSSTMDLLDEHFAFQFYIMGRLGLRVGVKALVYVGIGTGDVAQVGITVELGPYMKMYGFFIYEYEKYRPAHTTQWISNERMAGSIFMEFGLYFIMGFEASAAADLFSYSCDFFDLEIPLVSVGDEKYYYQPNYAPAEDEMVLVKDVDGNSNTGITMILPEEMLVLKYLHMTEGYLALDYVDYSNFIFTVSNPNFSIDSTTGEISVTVPDNTRYMECELTATYKYGKLSFSTYDMTITVPLVWTNLSTAELSEYYTAAVRVGNNDDGYKTVWSQRIRKNQEFDLPDAEEIMEIIGWNDDKYDMGTGYGSQQLEGLTLIDNEVYDFNIDFDTYAIQVANVQRADGTTESRTYYAQYGNRFDFSDLVSTGTNIDGNYTRFTELTVEGIDLTKAIDSRMAAALTNGVVAYANYIDNSVTATFTFTGMDAEDVTVTIRRGTVPSLAIAENVVGTAGLAIKEITPEVGAIKASTTYQVICGKLDTAPATITFVENGGSDVADITKPWGSLIGDLPVTAKDGYVFDGWFADEALTVPFTLTRIPETGAAAYAKWKAAEYTVTLHVNGGDALVDNQLTVSYGGSYGELPEAVRNGHGFIGWFTAAEGGEQITAERIYTLMTDQTLYAQYRKLEEIPAAIFDFGEAEVGYVYEKDVAREVLYTYTPGEGTAYTENEFTFKFMRQGCTDYVDKPINAGTYNVTVSRPADHVYAKFEHTYTGILTIDKANSSLDGTLSAETHGRAVIPTLSITSQTGDGAIEYKVGSDGTWSNTGVIYDLNPGTHTVYARLGEGMNYNASNSVEATVTVSASDTFKYILIVHTADEGNAGTDANISAQIGDGSFVHLDKADYNDFERNDTDAYSVSVPDTLSIDGEVDVTIKFEKKGIAAGWKLGWLRMDVYENYTRLYEGDRCDVYAWFEDTGSQTYTVTGNHLGRNVDTSSYGLQYNNGYITIDDTNISDNYKLDYDPYYYPNAPKLVAYFNDPIFNTYITRNSITEFYVDWDGVRRAVEDYRVASPTLNYGIDYGVNGGVYGAADEMYTVTE